MSAALAAALLVTAGALAGVAGCTTGRDGGVPAGSVPAGSVPAGSVQAGTAPDVAVADSRLVEGTDLCSLADPEELDWVLGLPLMAGPAPDPAEPGACTARFTDLQVSVAGRASATGVRATVAGNTAFADANDNGCRVSVALLPGSTARAGSYLSVAVVRAGPRQPLDCRTAGRLADYLLRQLPTY